MDDSKLPTPEEILATHEEIEEQYDMKYTGTRVAAPKLKLKRILEETAEHDGVYTRAAFLLRKLVTAHYFEDGNKRTAWVTMREYLQEHDETPAERGKESGKVLRRVRRFDVDEIATWLETGEIDEDRLDP
jgi:prophage maintenance system killer protein